MEDLSLGESIRLRLSFIGLTNIAYKMVNTKYPGSELLEADGFPPKGSTTNPREVTNWTYIFRTPDGGAATISTTTWGHFTPIKYNPKAFLGNVAIPWPIKMDIVEADQLLKKTGYTGPYRAVSLGWPLYPGNTETYYIFTMSNGETVFVGTKSKSVEAVNQKTTLLSKAKKK